MLFITSFALFGEHAQAVALSANDFLPPVQAESPEAEKAAQQIQQPDAVKEEKGIDGQNAIVAATAQDAANAAIQHMDAGAGCQQIKFPSGFGWVATGIGTYSVMPNPTATLMAQRQAYQLAYLNAKKNLAEALFGLSTEGQEQLKQEFNNVISDTGTLSNVSDSLKENIAEQVQGFLKGFVVYSVNDQQDAQSGTVTVSIVATPKTIGKGQRVDTSALTADTIVDGLNAVLSELSNGLMPPVGGKLISVPQTGEIAFIGFGSAVVVDNPNPAVKAKQSLQAQKMAAMRARSALCGIILGTDLQSSSSMDPQTQSMSKQFDEIQKEDPLNQNVDTKEVNKLAEQRNSFLTTQVSKEQIASFTKGILPPGVNVRSFFNPEKTMAEAVAVYIPSMSAGAKAAGEEMKKSQIMAPQNQTGNSSTQQQKPAMPAQGASGQVTKDADL